MGPTELGLLVQAFESNWIAPLGPHVDAFETEFAKQVGSAFAVAVSSGTAALHLALRLLNIGTGDEVVTSSMTFCATANSICYQGATPVFIDSDRTSWNMDPQLLEDELVRCAASNRLPRAAMIVDVNGQCANYAQLKPLLDRYEIPLIEDAAEALGATHHGTSAGRFGCIGCFSFNGNKIITTSGGGMLVTEDEALSMQARKLATQAREPAPHYEHTTVGYNYRLSNLLAAVGRGQLSVLEQRVTARRGVYQRYVQALSDLPGIDFMPEPEGSFSTRWLTSILVDHARFGASREDIRLALEANNVEARPVWKPMHLQPVFAKYRAVVNGVSEQLFRDGLCLPSGSSLSIEDQQRTVEIIRATNR